MSTLPGLASKGEKGKSKYQSLDINNLWKAHTGEPLESQQQKNTLPRKHGMQSLGKVPTARRPPANLPSLKSEHTGSDTAVSLVPSGGTGWGKQDGSPSSSTTSQTTSVTNSTVSSPSSNSSNTLPVSSTGPSPVGPTLAISKQPTPSATPVTNDKSWSAIMSGNEVLQPPPYHSPQFQHEFPSLSAGDGAPTRPGTDMQYGPGPSLRPQTEGSWIQGGSRVPTESHSKNSSVPPGASPQLSVPVGLPQQIPLPQQFRGFIPQFMCRGNFTPNGHGVPNFPNPPLNSTKWSGGINRGTDNKQPLLRTEEEDIVQRPIIKEEDLNRMDDLARDVGWASYDDIDYNQKLAFSDDESSKDDGKENGKTDQSSEDKKTKSITISGRGSRHSNEEDEVWKQRRIQQSEKVAMAVEKAKQRKEEEEKRFLEQKQAAAKKLQKLEEKLNKNKKDKELGENQGTISPLVVPPQPIMPAPIPVPEWEKEKDSNNRSLGEENSKPQIRDSSSEFHKLTQIEGRSFLRKDSHSVDRDSRERDIRDQSGPSFSKQFQSNLPPRFKKQQQLRNIASSPQLQSTLQPPYTEPYSWQSSQQMHGKNSSAHSVRQESEEMDSCRSDEPIKENHHSNNDSYTNFNFCYDTDTRSNKYGEEVRDDRSEDYDRREKKGDSWENERELEKEKQSKQDDQDHFEVAQTHHMTSTEEWRNELREKYDREEKYDKYDRPQRPDSRDSRTSKESRHSKESSRDFDSRDYHNSWADSPFDPVFDKKRKDNSGREERSRVPGPITKDRIEAEDYKNEKVLTQLKRGQIIEKLGPKKEKTPERTTKSDKNDEKEENKESEKGVVKLNEAKLEEKTNKVLIDSSSEKEKHGSTSNEKQKSNTEKEEKQGHGGSRRRQDVRGGWGFVYRNSWKRNDSRRNPRFGGSKKSLSIKTNDWQHTESEASADEVGDSGRDDNRSSQRSPKASKKSNKDEKTKENKHEKSDSKNEKDNRKDNYIPRGEPSRHGRGSSHFRSGRGGLTKRIDGYGPPPSKSPFSHLEEKDKKNAGENASEPEESNAQAQSSTSGVVSNNRTKEAIKPKMEDKPEGNKSRGTSNSRRNKGKKNKEGGGGSGAMEENCETSDNSEEYLKDKGSSKSQQKVNKPAGTTQSKRSSGRSEYRSGKNEGSRQVFGSTGIASYKSQGSVKKDEDVKINDFDEKCKGKEIQEETASTSEQGGKEEKDTDGFQEVKSKKNVQRQKPCDEKPPSKSNKGEERRDKSRKLNSSSSQYTTAQQISNIPSLMDTPVNPPPILTQSCNKDKFERNRQNKLPPRLAKQRENNRLQKAQIHQGMCDVNEMNKVNHNLNILDGSNSSLSNAWNKPLGNQLRVEPETLSTSTECVKNVDQPQTSPNQASPCIDKVVQNNHISDKTVLDGATPPVNTIIFENTNFKSAPGSRMGRNEKSCNKLEEGVMDNTVISNFNKPIRDLLNKNEKQQSESIPMQLAFTKEDSADMKLDFFESELTHLTEDKNSKNLGLPRSIHTITSVNSTISTADALNFKIASVKKVWETMPTVVEHSVGQDEGNNSFSASFGSDSNTLDPSSAFNKSADNSEDNHERYNTSPNQNVSNNTTNVCKVKPTQQIAGSTNQAIHTTGAHQQHSSVMGPGIVGHPLSPPPMQPVIGTGVGLGQPPQQFATNQHLGYQPNVGGTNQYGMSAIPSPPTVLFNSTQQLQAAAQSGLYGTFQIDQSQVLSSQGRSQFSQYPHNPYGLGQTASSPYSAQSMYLQGAQPHPPAAQPPPDLYPNISSYRLSATAPFGQNQQLSNPTTVLISSTSNSLMSATVKPSSQQISAIGTKAGGAGQAYQQTSQQGQQLYMTYDPTIQASYLPNTGVIQRGPNGPIQNNVVTALQPSSSFYTGSTGGQTAGFFQQPGSSALQSAPLQQHQTGYGLQGNMFGTPNQSHTSAGLQNFSSHFLSSPMQLAAAAALNAQQFRSQNLPNTTAYIKSVNNQHGDQSTRSQQLKSPANQQDVLSSVFNSGPQISSPKSKQNSKQPVPQSSPTSQHKYNLYQSINTQQAGQMQRYPTPIQRPMNFQSTMSSVQPTSNGPSNNNQKHRATNQNQKMGGRHYYGSQATTLNNSQHDKMEDKLVENVNSASNNSTIVSSSAMINKSVINTNGGGTVSESNKDPVTKEDANVKE